MKIKTSLILFLIVSTLLFSCKKDEEQSFGINISPSEDYMLRDMGNTINFTVKFESKEELAKYRITETINNSTTTIKDVAISGKKYIDWFDYTVPNTFENYGRHEIKLIFSSFDVDGKSMNRAKIIYVDVNERNLTEYAGNTMYSSLSSQSNAYDLLTNTPKFSSDSTSHIVDLSKPNISDSLGKVWVSPFGAKFTKLNSFDYSNATDLTVKNAYNSSIKSDTIRNINPNDIIITKINNDYIALKLIYVIDDTGSATDRYVFNIKR